MSTDAARRVAKLPALLPALLPQRWAEAPPPARAASGGWRASANEWPQNVSLSLKVQFPVSRRGSPAAVVLRESLWRLLQKFAPLSLRGAKSGDKSIAGDDANFSCSLSLDSSEATAVQFRRQAR